MACDESDRLGSSDIAAPEDGRTPAEGLGRYFVIGPALPADYWPFSLSKRQNLCYNRSRLSDMKRLFCLAALFAVLSVSHATLVVSPWNPLFKGIDHAVGTNFPSTIVTNNGVIFTDSTLQVVHCLRIDLTDPTVQLFATPRATNYVAGSRETLSLTVSNFVKKYGLAVATCGNFYDVGGGTDPTSEGLSANAHGALISKGVVVSAADTVRSASLLFTTNNVPIWNLTNNSPSTPTTGIFTAVTGFYPLLTNGVNVWNLYFSAFSAAYPDGSIHGLQPRTAFGTSQDKHYLFLMTIDGRQGTYSNGALDADSAMWMLLFGAWDAINMDGGGSTAMYMAGTYPGDMPIALNHSSYPDTVNPKRERIIGAHFGVYAQPLAPPFILNVTSTPAMTTADISWTTTALADSQVEYGLTPSYGSLSPLDPTFVTDHLVTLTGLTPGTRYYYRVLSSDGLTLYRSGASTTFSTTNNATVAMIYDLTKGWKYSTNNLDGTNWQASGYNDSAWSSGLGVLWTDLVNPGTGNPAIQFLPLNTEMPLNSVVDPNGSYYPLITYYFRTHFTYTNSPSGVTLTFSNYIDDGAAFYLNGVEINRTNLAVGATHATLASGFNCAGNADCPYVFSVSGANLQSGDNVVAVEVHNYSSHSPDITFGQALLSAVPPSLPPFISGLAVIPGETSATVSWTTLSNSTSRVAYGLTTSLTTSTPIDANLVSNHSVTITGLVPLTNYYFQVISTLGASTYTSNGTFSTVPFYVDLVSPTQTWSYTTNNQNGVNWQAPGFDESLMLGQGPALLYIETNPAVAPRNTPLPAAGGLPFPTYYFRTHFNFDTNLAGFSLVFTNYIDDGAVFYLNGTEIQRVRMAPAPTPVVYTDFATDCPHPVDCDAVTNAPDIFRISGDLLTNLIAGVENILAVEVHQRAASGSDIVFGSSLGLVRALASETDLDINLSGNIATISWDGLGFTLQQASTVMGTNVWSDVAGLVKTSPYSVTNPPATTFYRLRN